MRRKTPPIAWYVLGFIIAPAVGRTFFDYFTQLGKTEDWVLEYSNWIIVGVWVVCALIVAGFVLVPFLARRAQKRDAL